MSPEDARTVVSDEHSYREDQRLRPVERLKKRSQYLGVQRRGTRRSGDYFIVYARPNELAWSRIGVTASKKVGNAATRNWWKRRVKDCFRRNKPALPVGYDFVVIVKASADQDEYDELERECVRLANRAAD
jgi:ribonuclease P protein component